VPLRYPLVDGRPIFTAAARRPTLGPYRLAKIAVTGAGTHRARTLVRSTADLVEFTFCGNGPFCAYTPDATLPLQQAAATAGAVQLAVDAFAALPRAGQVLELLPAVPGSPPVALYFRRADLQPLAKGEAVSTVAAGLLDSGASLRTPPRALRVVLAVARAHAYVFRGAHGAPTKTELVLSPLASALRGLRPPAATAHRAAGRDVTAA
jgi:hypothetical protein